MEPSAFRWTLSKQKALLDFFRNHESMYNPQHVDYRNRRLREKLLQQLKDMIGCTPFEAKSKFHSLRTYFTKELTKVRHSKLPGNGPVYRSRWELFRDMLFVKDVYQPRPVAPCYPTNFLLEVAPADAVPTNADAVPIDTDAVPADADAAPTEATFHDQELEATRTDVEASTSLEFSPLPPQSSPEEVTSGHMHIEIPRQRTANVVQKKRRAPLERWSNGHDNEVSVAARKTNDRHLGPQGDSDSKDEDYCFAAMIAKELKHLRPLDKDILKLRMMEMIVEAKHNVVLEKCTGVVQVSEELGGSHS